MINKVIEAAKIAGNIAREGFRSNYNIEYKTNSSDLVTEFDKKCEAAIVQFIQTEFPNHSILAEESGETNTNSEYCWVIDPIDGTTNFAHGLTIFSVSIGVQKNGITICGAVYDVMMDTIYSAELGGGAFRNNEKISVSSNSDLSLALLVTGFPYDIHNYVPKISEIFTAMLLKSRAVRRLGSAALDFCYVASGVFDGYWESKLNPWDYCAGKLILEEAGGKVTNFAGADINIHSKEILATNSKIHTQMHEILNS